MGGQILGGILLLALITGVVLINFLRGRDSFRGTCDGSGTCGACQKNGTNHCQNEES